MFVETNEALATQPPRLTAGQSMTDPFGRTANSRVLFRDEGLGVLTWARNDARAKFNAHLFNGSRGLGESKSGSFDAGSGTPDAYLRHALAVGRVMSDDYDECFALKRISLAPAGNELAKVTWEISNLGGAVAVAKTALPSFTFTDNVNLRDDKMHMQTPGALAIADLDGMVIDGRTRDEIITVRETTGRDLTLEVFNFAWGVPASATAIRLPDPLAFLPRLGESQRRPGTVIVKTGDFSGNGKRQILVVYYAAERANPDKMWIQAVVYDYTVNANNRTTGLIQREKIIVADKVAGNTGLDVAVGDFLGLTGQRKIDGVPVGLGREQVAVIYHADGRRSGGNDNICNLIVTMLDRDPYYALKEGGVLAVRHHHKVNNRDDFKSRVKTPDQVYLQGPRKQVFALAAGQYRLDPAKGYTLGRKQLAVVYSVLATERKPFAVYDDTYNYLKAVGFSVSAAQAGGDGAAAPVWSFTWYGQAQTRDTGELIVQLDAKAANLFDGQINPPTPTDTLVMASLTNNGGGKPGVVTLHRGTLNVDGPQGISIADYDEKNASSDPGFGSADNTGVAVVAYDFQGRSTQLGPPVRITINNILSTSYVLQEPPKHIDYLPNNDPPTPLGIVNVSLNPSFNITYTDEQSKQVTTARTNIVADTFNHSDELTVGAGVTVGDIKKTGMSINVTETVKFGYAYNEKTTEYGSEGSSLSTKLSASTNCDDALSYVLETTDIYRYRMLGRKTASGDYVFVDISVPRPFPDQAVSCDGSMLPDVYQPTHQNGNALSYPVLAPGMNVRYTPADMGGFRRPSKTPGQSVEVTEPLTTPILYFCNGNSEAVDISWSASTAETNSFEYSKTLSGSSDTTVSYEASAEYLLFSTSVKASFKTSTGGSHGWTNQRVNNITGTRTRKLLLTKPSSNKNMGYGFLPLFYVTRDGTLKMASATSFTEGVGQEWWAKTYAAPDAALNLPYRFLPDGSGFNTLDNARRIRGGLAYYDSVSQTTGQRTPVSGAVKPGTMLMLEVRVHNFSLGSRLGVAPNGALKPVKVRFDYVEVDPVSREETGTRSIIGTADVEFVDANLADPSHSHGQRSATESKHVIPPRGIGRARLAFKTPVLPEGALTREYRIYAVVDPENEIRWRRSDGTLAPQTHVRHTDFATIRLRNIPLPGVEFKIELQDQNKTVLETITYVCRGSAGQAEVLNALASALQASPKFKEAGLQINPDALQPSATVIRISSATGNAKIKPGDEHRSGVVSADGKAIYFVPSVRSASGQATTHNAISITNDSPAQNKEGWFPLVVASAAQTVASQNASLTPLAVRNAHGELASDYAEVVGGRYASFRIGVDAEVVQDTGGWAEVFLGEPERGGQLLGTIVLHPMPGGAPNYVWGEWLVPSTPGSFALFVRLTGANQVTRKLMNLTIVA
ncbi:hypothetical protein [Ralstonia sp. 24A2]|uniref:hypothetical protein n=1 Tax=Ralstonia sp. 24A2 TaxID=3447364 RepID=UPI003F6A4C76